MTNVKRAGSKGCTPHKRGNNMNEWMLGGIVVVGTIVALGGGSWIVNTLRGKKGASTKE